LGDENEDELEAEKELIEAEIENNEEIINEKTAEI